jgi:ABC-type nitrate/sulfonate/bicarbonate transport system permease component
MTRLAFKAAAILAVVGLWQLLSGAGVVNSTSAPTPSRIAGELGSLVVTSSFWQAVRQTLEHWALGLGVSAAIAIPVGLVLGASDVVYRAFRFTIDFLRTIPPVAVIPLALLLYGATTRMVVTLIVFGATWPLLLQTMYGVHQIDPLARDMAASYRLRRRDRVLSIALPSAAPFVATGIRLAATFSLLLAIGAELIGGAPGMGSKITLSQAGGAIPTMYAYVVASALVGLAINLLMSRIERRVLSWHHSARALVPA